MPCASMSTVSKDEALVALETHLGDLIKIKVFDDDVRTGVQRILDTMPSPDTEKDTDRKVRLLLLRCKAKLLLPFVSKDAEKDVHMALKLKQGSAEMWVELSECLLRRNSFKEACDALDNALRVEPLNTAALCKYSQVQRNRCGEAGLTAEQKAKYLNDAVTKSRLAVQSNMDDADAWNTLSLSLLSMAASEGMTHTGVRKALAAMQLAESKASGDPDIHFNKAVLESLAGEFGAAAADYIRAHELDSTRLSGTRRLCEENVSILQRAVARMKSASGIGRGDFKRIQAGLKSAMARAKEPITSTRHVAVADILTGPAMQPQATLTVDEHGAFAFLLVYGVSGGSFKIGDVLSFPLSETHQVTVIHSVPAAAQFEVDGISLTMSHYYPAASDLLINERSLPSRSRVPIQLSSRLFA